jgi:hypothetical protein
MLITIVVFGYNGLEGLIGFDLWLCSAKVACIAFCNEFDATTRHSKQRCLLDVAV